MVYLINFLAVMFSGLVQGVSGFGFVIFALPIMLLVLPSKTVIPIIVIVALVNTLIILVECRAGLNLKKIWPLLPASLIGVPLGTLILTKVSVNVIQVFVGLVTITFAALVAKGIKIPVKREKLSLVPVGVFSGLLNGSISMGGPPIALFFSNQETKKKEFRANLIFFFFFTNVITIISFYFARLFTRETILNSFYLIPPMIIGTLIGIALVKKLNENLFRKIVLYITVVIGFVALISGVALI